MSEGAEGGGLRDGKLYIYYAYGVGTCVGRQCSGYECSPEGTAGDCAECWSGGGGEVG